MDEDDVSLLVVELTASPAALPEPPRGGHEPAQRPNPVSLPEPSEARRKEWATLGGRIRRADRHDPSAARPRSSASRPLAPASPPAQAAAPARPAPTLVDQTADAIVSGATEPPARVDRGGVTRDRVIWSVLVPCAVACVTSLLWSVVLLPWRNGERPTPKPHGAESAAITSPAPSSATPPVEADASAAPPPAAPNLHEAEPPSLPQKKPEGAHPSTKSKLPAKPAGTKPAHPLKRAGGDGMPAEFQ